MSEALTFKEQHGIESMRVVIHQGLLGATADEMRATPQRFRGWESGVLKPEEVLYDYQTVMECRNSRCRAGGLHLGPILSMLAGAHTETAKLEERCEGHEGHRMQRCHNFYTVAVTIRYTMPSRQTGGKI
jgi:hypothetical protein